MDVLAELTTPEFRRAPQEFLRRLAENHPVIRTSRGFYLVTRHADVEWVLRNTGTVFRNPDHDKLVSQFPQALRHEIFGLLVTSLPSLNPPAHTRLRRLVAASFTPRTVDGLRARIAEICERLLDPVVARLRAGEVVDLHAQWAKPISINLLSELLGVPEGDREWLAEQVQGFTSALGGASEELLNEADLRVGRLREYVGKLTAELRAVPRDGLISALVRTVDEDGDRLTEDELFSIVWALWVAGFGSTAVSLNLGVRIMGEHPDQCGWLRGDHDQAAAFADEVLRYSGGPVLYPPMPRLSTQDVTLSGTFLPAGTDVRPMLAAANHDPGVFPDPGRFDPSRDNSAALAFSHGIHRCLGAFLARTELAIGLKALHARLPRLTCVSEPAWNPAPNLRSPLDLTVALDT
jgi:cytochrome P450 family 114